jgi:hypothetical protein
MNINDFVEGFQVGSSGLNLNNVRIPVKGGGTIQIDQMSIAPSSTIGDPPLILHGALGGNGYNRSDGSAFSSYRYECGRNLYAKTRFNAIMISVPSGSNDRQFRKSY